MYPPQMPDAEFSNSVREAVRLEMAEKREHPTIANIALAELDSQMGTLMSNARQFIRADGSIDFTDIRRVASNWLAGIIPSIHNHVAHQQQQFQQQQPMYGQPMGGGYAQPYGQQMTQQYPQQQYNSGYFQPQQQQPPMGYNQPNYGQFNDPRRSAFQNSTQESVIGARSQAAKMINSINQQQFQQPQQFQQQQFQQQQSYQQPQQQQMYQQPQQQSNSFRDPMINSEGLTLTANKHTAPEVSNASQQGTQIVVSEVPSRQRPDDVKILRRQRVNVETEVDDRDVPETFTIGDTPLELDVVEPELLDTEIVEATCVDHDAVFYTGKGTLKTPVVNIDEMVSTLRVLAPNTFPIKRGFSINVTYPQLMCKRLDRPISEGGEKYVSDLFDSLADVTIDLQSDRMGALGAIETVQDSLNVHKLDLRIKDYITKFIEADMCRKFQITLSDNSCPAAFTLISTLESVKAILNLKHPEYPKALLDRFGHRPDDLENVVKDALSSTLSDLVGSRLKYGLDSDVEDIFWEALPDIDDYSLNTFLKHPNVSPKVAELSTTEEVLDEDNVVLEEIQTFPDAAEVRSKLKGYFFHVVTRRAIVTNLTLGIEEQCLGNLINQRKKYQHSLYQLAFNKIPFGGVLDLIRMDRDAGDIVDQYVMSQNMDGALYLVRNTPM